LTRRLALSHSNTHNIDLVGVTADNIDAQAIANGTFDVDAGVNKQSGYSFANLKQNYEESVTESGRVDALKNVGIWLI
jgi:hypothetical protein